MTTVDLSTVPAEDLYAELERRGLDRETADRIASERYGVSRG